jgi:hypothetical protein
MLNGLETAAVQEQISSAVAVLNQKPHLFNTSILLLHGRSFQPVQHHFARIGN